MKSDFFKQSRYLCQKCEIDLHYMEYAPLEDYSSSYIDLIEKLFQTGDKNIGLAMMVSEINDTRKTIDLYFEKLQKLGASVLNTEHAENISLLHNSISVHLEGLYETALKYAPGMFKDPGNYSLMRKYLKPTNSTRIAFEGRVKSRRGRKQEDLEDIFDWFKPEHRGVGKIILEELYNELQTGSVKNFACLCFLLEEMKLVLPKGRPGIIRGLKKFFARNVGTRTNLENNIARLSYNKRSDAENITVIDMRRKIQEIRDYYQSLN